MLIVGIAAPVDGLNFRPFEESVASFAESEKDDSPAVTRLRRSDFIAAMYAFDLVFANFGIAIAARIPMITTTIRSSIRVKPLRMESIQTPVSEEGVVLSGPGGPIEPIILSAVE